MIQESINQLLTTAGIAGRLLPSYENRQAAKSIYSKGIAAETGLKDIAKSIKRVESGKRPEYSDAELKDIERRVGEHVSNIGTLKTAAIPGQETAPYIPTNKKGRVEGLASRKSYSKTLQGIESSLSAMKEKAMQSMTEKGQAALQQDDEFKKLKEQLLEKDNIINQKQQEFEKVLNLAYKSMDQTKQYRDMVKDSLKGNPIIKEDAIDSIFKDKED